MRRAIHAIRAMSTLAACSASAIRHPKSALQLLVGLLDWNADGFAAPPPIQVKRQTLLRNSVPGAPWIETGTFRGDGTAFLAEHFPEVVTIEPHPGLFQAARRRFASNPAVRVINALSEESLPQLCAEATGDMNFFLDAHYVNADAHTGEGGELPKAPIIQELQAIEENIGRFDNVAVLVDDIRCFGRNRLFPPLDIPVSFASRLGFHWTIEHDIFIARNSALPATRY